MSATRELGVVVRIVQLSRQWMKVPCTLKRDSSTARMITGGWQPRWFLKKYPASICGEPSVEQPEAIVSGLVCSSVLAAVATFVRNACLCVNRSTPVHSPLLARMACELCSLHRKRADTATYQVRGQSSRLFLGSELCARFQRERYKYAGVPLLFSMSS